MPTSCRKPDPETNAIWTLKQTFSTGCDDDGIYVLLSFLLSLNKYCYFS